MLVFDSFYSSNDLSLFYKAFYNYELNMCFSYAYSYNRRTIEVILEPKFSSFLKVDYFTINITYK